ncbi:allantoinase PuuE [Nocardioides ginsengisoli]|uniref:Polysaccharide deacetylase family protein n=1 Tax=Nocardioides ginsengisoli TaxID=363868 RepID=A0ABW3VVB4_9ACTN
MTSAHRYDRPRDLAGYGEHPPAALWPTGDRVAVSLVVNIEDGAERHRSRGDAVDDVNAHWITDIPHDSGNPSLESGFDYGARAGIWRVLRILDAAGVPSTAFACGRALEHHPALGQALADRDVEVVDHGLWWEPHGDLSPDTLRRRMDESAGILHRTTGAEPTSWYSKDGHSRASLDESAARGFGHDDNCFNDDRPSLPDGPDGAVTIPYSADTNDSLLLTTFATARQYGDQLVAALDMLLDDDRPGAKVLSVGLHPRWIGRPSYAGALQRFIAHGRRTPGVVFAQRSQIARWWRSMSLSDGAGVSPSQRPAP